jgi:hypothetical protein
VPEAATDFGEMLPVSTSRSVITAMSEGLPSLDEEGGVDPEGAAEISLARLDVKTGTAPTESLLPDAHATVASRLNTGITAKNR